MYTIIGFWFDVPTITSKSGRLTVKFQFVLSAMIILWVVTVNGELPVSTVAVTGTGEPIPVSWEPSPKNVVADTEPVTVRDPVISAEPVYGNPAEMPVSWEPSPLNEPEMIEAEMLLVTDKEPVT